MVRGCSSLLLSQLWSFQNLYFYVLKINFFLCIPKQNHGFTKVFCLNDYYLLLGSLTLQQYLLLVFQFGHVVQLLLLFVTFLLYMPWFGHCSWPGYRQNHPSSGMPGVCRILLMQHCCLLQPSVWSNTYLVTYINFFTYLFRVYLLNPEMHFYYDSNY